MQYSPKLKIAAEEIKEIMAKHDIAGVIVLHTPGHTEFVLNITPTYSCAWVQGGMMRFKALKKDYNSIEEWKLKVKDTTGMFHGLSVVTGKLAMDLINASELCDKATGAEHTSGGFTDQTTQNN